MAMMQAEQRRRDQELSNKILDTTHDNELDDDKFEHEVLKDRAEIMLEAQQQRAVSIN
jgi:predicted neutral ceramidase superfamily lipid hydrolase